MRVSISLMRLCLLKLLNYASFVSGKWDLARKFFYVSQLCGVHVSVVWFKDAVDLLSIRCCLSLSISDCGTFDVFSRLLLVCMSVCLSCFFTNNLIFHFLDLFLYDSFDPSILLLSVLYSYWACMLVCFYSIHMC